MIIYYVHRCVYNRKCMLISSVSVEDKLNVSLIDEKKFNNKEMSGYRLLCVFNIFRVWSNKNNFKTRIQYIV